MKPYRIGIPIIDQVDLLDVCNAVEVFRWMGSFRKKERESSAPLIGKTKDPVTTGNGVVITPDACFADFADDPLDALYVPGGGGDYVKAAMANDDLIKFVTNQAAAASLVTSVCTGAFILAKAKLLDGHRCTTHWFFQDQFRADFPNALLVNGYPRYVHDAKIVTGGGISSAIDESIFITSLIAGDEIAKCIQLAIQYHPNPPFTDGDPCQADYKTWARVMKAWDATV